jgi:nucleoside-diphosphate-sugar epimerase
LVTDVADRAAIGLNSIPLGKVLVTGASGFLGRRVLSILVGRSGVEELLAAGRRPAQPDAPAPLGVTAVQLDLTAAIRIPAGVRTVIHIAGEKRDPNLMQAVNAEGARRLAVAAAQAGVARFVHVSSVGVYGAPPGSGVVDETFPHTPVNPYERSKDAGEHWVRQTCADEGVGCVVVRPSNVIGLVPGGGAPLRGLVRSIGRGQFVWFGPERQAWLNYLHVADGAAAIAAAAEFAPAGREYNVNCPARLAEAVAWIAEELAVPYPRRHLPRWLGRAAAEVGSFVSTATGRGLPLDRGRYRELTNDTMFDASRLSCETGFAYPLGAEPMFRALARAYRSEVVR